MPDGEVEPDDASQRRQRPLHRSRSPRRDGPALHANRPRIEAEHRGPPRPSTAQFRRAVRSTERATPRIRVPSTQPTKGQLSLSSQTGSTHRAETLFGSRADRHAHWQVIVSTSLPSSVRRRWLCPSLFPPGSPRDSGSASAGHRTRLRNARRPGPAPRVHPVDPPSPIDRRSEHLPQRPADGRCPARALGRL
jgi:hypothetical protein